MGGGGLVVPDVCAASVAAAGVVVGAFEAVEFAVGGAEADGRYQGGEVGAGCVLDGGGDGRFAHGGGKPAGLFLEGWQVFGGVFGGGPGVGEARGVVVADEGVFIAGRGAPAAAPRRAVGEMPGEKERVIGVGAGRDGAAERERAHGSGVLRLGTEFAIGGKVVPEEHGRVPPAAALPSAKVGDAGAGGIEHGDEEAAFERVVAGQFRAGHENAGQPFGRFVFVDARVLGLGAAGGVFNGPGDGDLGGRRAGVGDAVAQDGDWQAGLVGFVRDEGREGFKRDFDGQGGIGEVDARQREFAGEGCRGEAREAGRVVCAQPAGAFEGRLDARFEHAGDGLAVAGLRPDGGEGVRGRVAFVGTVEDLPIAKLPAPSEADAPGADAAEREGDGGETPSGEDTGECDFGSGGRCWRGRDRHWGLRGGLSGGTGKGHLLEEGAALGGHQV